MWLFGCAEWWQQRFSHLMEEKIIYPKHFLIGTNVLWLKGLRRYRGGPPSLSSGDEAQRTSSSLSDHNYSQKMLLQQILRQTMESAICLNSSKKDKKCLSVSSPGVKLQVQKWNLLLKVEKRVGNCLFPVLMICDTLFMNRKIPPGLPTVVRGSVSVFCFFPVIWNHVLLILTHNLHLFFQHFLRVFHQRTLKGRKETKIEQMRKKETFLSGNNRICELFTIIVLICVFNVDVDPFLKHAGRHWGQISETKSH